MAQLRKIPVRTCCACRTCGPKQGLLRIVRRPDGIVEIDPTGKMAGRGTYICPTEECLRKAIKEKRLSRSLRTEVPPEVFGKIEDAIKQGSEMM